MKQIKINKNIPISASYDWFKLAFITFREKPLQYISLALLEMFTIGVSSYLLVGGLVGPAFSAQFASLSNQIENDQYIGMFATFKKILKNKSVILLMLVNLLCSLVGMFLLSLDQGDTTTVTQKILISILLLVFMVSVNMAMWISPVICVFDDMRPLDAMRLSLRVGLYNIGTWILYAVFAAAILIVLGVGIVYVATEILTIKFGFVFCLLILACIILSIFSLMFFAICNIASYHIYKDAFIIE